MREHGVDDDTLRLHIRSAQRDAGLTEMETRPYTILLVDDEPHVLAGLRRALRKEPYEILCADSVSHAFVYLRAKAVDLVISDQDMPGMTGTAFLAKVRQ